MPALSNMLVTRKNNKWSWSLNSGNNGVIALTNSNLVKVPKKSVSNFSKIDFNSSWGILFLTIVV